MTTQDTAHGSETVAVHATSDSHFSWFRTRLSLERTLMSWARTSVSLIGFGFTIVQFFERFGDMQGVEAALRPQAPRYVGLTMIAAGILGLIISIIQYRQIMKYLWEAQFAAIAGIRETPGWTPLLAVSVLLALIGVAAFASILFRLV